MRCRGFHAVLKAIVRFYRTIEHQQSQLINSSSGLTDRPNIMRIWATSRSTTAARMAATTMEPIPDASSVSALHDGGPDWEEREKASFDSRRGSNVWYRRWSPKSKAVAMLMIAHGLHSHGGRWARVAHHYTEKGYLVYANDHIGHGLTAQGPNGGAIGMVDDHTKMTDDFTEFVEKMVDKEEDKTLPVFILGHSMGSLVATVSAEECVRHPTIGPRFKKLVLSGCPIVPGPSSASPFGFRCLYPLTKNAAMLRRLAGMMARMDPKGPAAPIDQGALSKDPTVALEAKADLLMVKGSVRNKTAFEVVKLIQAAKESASKVTVPTLLVHGAEDDIAYPKGSEDMKELLTSCTAADCQVYEGVMHEVLNHQEHFQTVVAAVDKHLEVS